VSTPDELLGQMLAQASQVGAMLQEAHEPKRFEYRLVRWEKVNELAREGWIVQQACGSWSPDDGHVTVFLLVRPLSIADEAAELLAH
jgi:hypothetical protein